MANVLAQNSSSTPAAIPLRSPTSDTLASLGNSPDPAKDRDSGAKRKTPRSSAPM